MLRDLCVLRLTWRGKINFLIMKKYITSMLLLLGVVCSAYAQQGRLVSDVELLNTNGKVATIPYFGSRNLLIFYVDPDRIGQNDAFIQELRGNQKLSNKELFGMTILSAKDAPNVPERLLYKIATKRAEITGSQFFIDPDLRIVSSWRLGESNDLSTIIIVSKRGELLFMNKGKISEEDKARFYRVMDGL